MIKYFLKHYLEMFIGHVKSFILFIKDSKRYRYLSKIRGNYFYLFKIKNKFKSRFKSLLNSINLSNYILISRIKTISSVNRKDIYSKIINSDANHTDSIGFKIICKNKKDCYKVLNLLLENFNLQKIKGKDNPEDFFKNPKLMRQTNSVCKSQIFVKINYFNCNIHFIIIPKSDMYFIDKQRDVYIKYIKNIIKNHI